MQVLDVAVVGCGRMGRIRAQAALRWGAAVRAVFDTDAGRAAELAGGLPDCRGGALDGPGDWSAFDAVFVCTPPAQRDSAHAAILQGVPAFMEKPAGLAAGDAALLAGAARQMGVITAVGYMNRYREHIVALREELRGTRLLGASATWVNGAYAVPWWTQGAQSGGSLNEQATHVVDLFRYLLGEPHAVQALASPHPAHPGIVGNAVLSMSFADGALATLLYSCRAQAKGIGLRLYTEGGETVLRDWDFHPETGDGAPPAPVDRNRIFDIETAAFLRAVASGDARHVRCTLDDALRTQRVIDAAARSLQTGGTCAVPMQDDSCLALY